MFLNVMLLLPTPLLTMYLIDTVLPEKNLSLLSLISISVILLLLLRGVISFYQNFYFLRINERIIFNIQKNLFEKIQQIPIQKRNKLQTGYLLSRLKDDPFALKGLFVDSLLSVLKDALSFIVGFVVIMFIDWKLALLCIAILPFLIFSLIIFSTKIRTLSGVYFENNAKVLKKMQESISLIDTFKLFNANKFDEIKLIHVMSSSVRSFIKKTLAGYTSTIITGIITGIIPVIIIWYGISEIIAGKLLIGELIAFNSFIGYLFGPTKRLMNINIIIQQSLAAWSRVYELLNITNSTESRFKTQISKSIHGHISFENTSFSYETDMVFKNINIEIKPGFTLGIVGESGSGKSTLVKLLPLLHSGYIGSIKIDGIELNDYDPKCLRKQIKILDQEPQLFSDTIYRNIKLGSLNCLKKDIVKAAKMAQIHEFIQTLPNGYETQLDERGLNLSIGQKQRIAIARAILSDPPILILDEPTSSLDLESEKNILFSLQKFMENRTVIIIAHRLSTVKEADHIVFLKNGHIVEEGFHSELITLENGHYRNYWDIQNLQYK